MIFIFVKVVLEGEPVHWGRRGPIMPPWLGVLFVSAFTVVWLRGCWSGVTRAQLHEVWVEYKYDFRHRGKFQTLGIRDKDPDSN